MEKIYLGDGVYARIDEFGDLVLTAENGIQATDTIHIDGAAWRTLVKYVEVVQAKAGE